MREVELPNGSIGEFPDSMDDAAIASVLRKQFPAKTYTDAPGENYSNEGRSQAPTLRQTLENQFAGGFAEKLGGVVRDVAVGARKGVRDMVDSLDKEVVAGPASPVPSDHPVARDARAYVSPESLEANKAYGAAGPAAGVGRVLPELALTAVPIAGASAKLAQGARMALPKALQGLSGLIGDVGANAGYAAATAAPGEAADAAKWGAAGAVGGRVLGRAIGLGKSLISKDAQALVDAGVRPTPGQLFGDGPIGSTVRRLEDAATSLPLVGDALKYARNRSLSEYGNAEINAALRPLGVAVKGSGADAVEQAQRIISSTYDKVLPQTVIRPQIVKQALVKALDDIDNIPLLTTEQGGLIRRYVSGKILPTAQEATQRGGAIPGEIANRIDGEIGHYAREFTKSQNPSDHSLGEAFYALQSALRETVEGLTPEATKTLGQARTAYRHLLPIVSAADKTASGQFTPRQLNRGASKFDQAPSALNRAGQNVLPSTIPDSGTAGRALWALAIGGGGAALAGHAAPAAVAAALYSSAGVGLMVKGLRGDLAPGVYNVLIDMAPHKQAEWLVKFAQQHPQFKDRISEVGQQLVSQIGRAMAAQGGQDAPRN
ncbi:hypothetical protein RT97_28280 [Variovorax paradoxus]|uniref:Uncharacterized protein n=1 Tax=Variovorax paradoxus TaxID=34073 RepID=A0A0D0LSQ5_VARPD|nr:hypothetical protein [Variovorax paradoxus]KIQ20550.1 hypothetical protein RT97_28280 [Variovorax paradoxus]